jgi:curved DNA-binding protein CbpA
VTAQREWFDKDYYRTLGVDKGSSAQDITKAYRKLARKLHPDANPGDDAAEQRFKEITAAYDVLGNETKREEYDQVRAMGPMAGMGGASGGGFGGHGGVPFDLGDVFGGLFGQGGRGHRGGTRGFDLETRLGLSFLDAVSGRDHLGQPDQRYRLFDVWWQRSPSRHQAPPVRGLWGYRSNGRQPGPVLLQPALWLLRRKWQSG